jgi:hypothetical protein
VTLPLFQAAAFTGATLCGIKDLHGFAVLLASVVRIQYRPLTGFLLKCVILLQIFFEHRV